MTSKHCKMEMQQSLARLLPFFGSGFYAKNSSLLRPAARPFIDIKPAVLSKLIRRTVLVCSPSSIAWQFQACQPSTAYFLGQARNRVNITVAVRAVSFLRIAVVTQTPDGCMLSARFAGAMHILRIHFRWRSSPAPMQYHQESKVSILY